MPENRLPDGRFLKGVSGNPGGKPKGLPEFREHLMAKCYPKAVAALEAALDDHKQWAVELTVAYCFGKPQQAVVGPDNGPIITEIRYRWADEALDKSES